MTLKFVQSAARVIVGAKCNGDGGEEGGEGGEESGMKQEMMN